MSEAQDRFLFEFSAMMHNLLNDFLIPRGRERSLRLILGEEKIKALGDTTGVGQQRARRIVLEGNLEGVCMMARARVINNSLLALYTNYSSEYERVMGLLLRLWAHYSVPLEQ